jgi:hypothetical protein
MLLRANTHSRRVDFRIRFTRPRAQHLDVIYIGNADLATSRPRRLSKPFDLESEQSAARVPIIFLYLPDLNLDTMRRKDCCAVDGCDYCSI